MNPPLFSLVGASVVVVAGTAMAALAATAFHPSIPVGEGVKYYAMVGWVTVILAGPGWLKAPRWWRAARVGIGVSLVGALTPFDIRHGMEALRLYPYFLVCTPIGFFVWWRFHPAAASWLAREESWFPPYPSRTSVLLGLLTLAFTATLKLIGLHRSAKWLALVVYGCLVWAAVQEIRHAVRARRSAPP